MLSRHNVWGRNDLVKRGGLHLNWRGTDILASRFASATEGSDSKFSRLYMQGHDRDGRKTVGFNCAISMLETSPIR